MQNKKSKNKANVDKKEPQLNIYGIYAFILMISFNSKWKLASCSPFFSYTIKSQVILHQKIVAIL